MHTISHSSRRRSKSVFDPPVPMEKEMKQNKRDTPHSSRPLVRDSSIRRLISLLEKETSTVSL